MNRNQQNTVYLQSGDPETEARPASGQYGAGFTQTDPYIGQLGSLLTVKDPADGTSKQYRLVQNDSVMGTLPSEGAVAWWKDRAAYLVTTDGDAVGRGNIAGIYRRVSAVNDLICIQRRGKSTVQIQTGTPTAAGLHVIPSATDAKADVAAAGTAPAYPLLGISVSVQDGGTPDKFTAQLDVEDGMAEG
jgi:hypothetical protein